MASPRHSSALYRRRGDRMRRREFLAGVLATATPSVLWAADPNKVYHLAVCSQFGMDSFSNTFWTRLFNQLRQEGYTEGKNLIVNRYATQGRPERFAEIAHDIVQAKPDVIALGFDHAFIAQVAKETSTIPIVAAMGDPVAAGTRSELGKTGTQHYRCRSGCRDRNAGEAPRHSAAGGSFGIPRCLSLESRGMGRGLGSCGLGSRPPNGSVNHRYTDGAFGGRTGI